MGDERGSWTGPGGVRVTAVRLSGAHGVWAARAGVRCADAFLVTRDGEIVGYYATVEELADVLDLAELRAD
jgi:hypothetical protein